MADLYTLQLQNPDNELSVTRNISAAGHSIVLKMDWPTYIEEQYNIILQYFETCAQSDPLLVEQTYVRTYNYCEYYYPLFDKTETELRDWISTASVLPQSVASGSNDNEKLTRLQNNIARCKAAWPLIQQYEDILCWSFKFSMEGDIVTGVIRPGGWYRTASADFQFRFVADTDHIGKDNLGIVTIEFEVGQDL